MNHLKKILPLFLLTFISIQSHAQGRQNNFFDHFDSCRSKISDPNSVDMVRIEFDAMNSQVMGQSQTFVGMDTSANYKFLYTREVGWEQTTKTANGIAFGTITINQCEEIYEGWEIFKGLAIDPEFVRLVPTQPLTNFPYIPELRNPSLHNMIPFTVNNHYLFVRYLSTYPSGSGTEWDRQILYYFEKVE